MGILFSKNVVEDYVDGAVKQALQIHLTPAKGEAATKSRAVTVKVTVRSQEGRKLIKYQASRLGLIQQGWGEGLTKGGWVGIIHC